MTGGCSYHHNVDYFPIPEWFSVLFPLCHINLSAMAFIYSLSYLFALLFTLSVLQRCCGCSVLTTVCTAQRVVCSNPRTDKTLSPSIQLRYLLAKSTVPTYVLFYTALWYYRTLLYLTKYVLHLFTVLFVFLYWQPRWLTVFYQRPWSLSSLRYFNKHLYKYTLIKHELLFAYTFALDVIHTLILCNRTNAN